MLVRRHVAKLLADYYAQPANRVVGSVLLTEGEDMIKFKSLLGEFHYKRLVSRLYDKQEGRWLTSVELMRPFYSRALGNFVAANHQQEQQNDKTTTTTNNNNNNMFDIVEIGGGRGTNANIILSHLQQVYPEVYDRINSFTMIDASPPLLELQKQTLMKDHASKMKFELKDMIDVAEGLGSSFLSSSDIPTILIACELLDNLPHDKVRRSVGGGGGKRSFEQAEISHVVVEQDDEDGVGESSQPMMQEVFKPMSDPLLSKVLKLAPEYIQTGQTAWVPTVACGLLDRLHQSRPNSTLLLADFDWLPPPDYELKQDEGEERRLSAWAPGEPIVTDMEGRDHACYIVSPDHCDILFPTNFSNLARFVSRSWNIRNNNSKYEVNVHKQSEFLELYGPEQVQATTSWLTSFSPMLHDFANCSLLTVSNRTSSRKSIDSSTTKEEGRQGHKLKGRPVKRKTMA